MELKEITDLITAVSKSSLSEFSLEEGNLKLTLKSERLQNGSIVSTPSIISNVSKIETSIEEAKMETGQIQEGHKVTSPLVGTFYNSPSPDTEAYVKVGDTVKKGQTLAIIEAMKLMNEIESEYDGTVIEILAENEAIVEYGQTLFVIQ